jgi:hypothetical protein
MRPLPETRTAGCFQRTKAWPGVVSRISRSAGAKTWAVVDTTAKIGRETTTYVRNIYKYYVAYKLTLDAQESQRKAREQVAPARP